MVIIYIYNHTKPILFQCFTTLIGLSGVAATQPRWLKLTRSLIRHGVMRTVTREMWLWNLWISGAIYKTPFVIQSVRAKPAKPWIDNTTSGWTSILAWCERLASLMGDEDDDLLFHSTSCGSIPGTPNTTDSPSHFAKDLEPSLAARVF